MTVGALVAIVAVGAVLAAGTANAKQSALPRETTLYTSGTAWGPFTSFNPLRERVRDRHARASLRDAVPVRPAQGQVHPVARDRRQVGRQDATSSTLRKGVKWNDGKPFTGADVKFTFETGKLEGSRVLDDVEDRPQSITIKGNTVSFSFKGKPNYLDWDTNIYSIPIVPEAHLVELQRNRDHHRKHRRHREAWSAPGRSCTAPARERPATLQWNRRTGWWATKALGMKMPMQYIVDIHNTPEHRVAAELPQGQHRPEQQLLPGGRQADRREGLDVLQERAVHAVGEHRLARAEHDEGAAQRQGVPPGARDVDQRRPDRDGRLRQHRREGEPDRSAADLEQVDRPGPG